MGKRKYSTRAGEGYPSRPSPTTESSTWDHIFDTVSPTPPQNTNSHRGRPLGPPPAKVSQALANRSKMSKSELDAFNDMFNMIFDALGDKSTTPAPPATSAGIGGTLSRMRGHALRRTADLTLDGNKDKAQMELDKDIEEIELCESDYEVMQWTLRRLLNNADLPHPIRGPGCLRHIIRLLNTKFQNPHLALALFQYAREANTAAYVVLCTAPVYGELIHIQWSAFRDLGAVRATLEEMIANAVDPDGFVTRSILAIGRELAERDGTAGVIVDGRMCGTGIDEREVWATVERCEAIVRSTQDGRKEPGNWRKEVQKLEWDLKGEDETRHFRDMVRPADEEPISYPNPGFT
ncbi:hypothetical protein OE88DRAFT_1706797 [Heliocybe sulcata]|uniref:Mtf2-like C-terminal domain-containing protein n=1 Tax=Heliocybe sulcata TaxID=5364 RepID=A0A5C3MQ41_9AGAM|nr:hypothetical protein OE88DRAFT_1706797 [Heliocybe sulcata]